MIQLLLRPRYSRSTLGEHSLHRLEEGHIVADSKGLLVRHRQRTGLGQVSDGAHVPLLAVLLGENMLLGGGQKAHACPRAGLTCEERAQAS